MRIDRGGALPDRCVLCNGNAEGFRQARKLYWTPPAWRALGWIAVVGTFLAAAILRRQELGMLIGPLVVAIFLVQALVRRKLVLELGLCLRHRPTSSLYRILGALGMIVAVMALAFAAGFPEVGLLLVLVGFVVLTLVDMFGAFGRVRAITLKKLTAEHAWLARTGKAFIAALPELPK